MVLVCYAGLLSFVGVCLHLSMVVILFFKWSWWGSSRGLLFALGVV